MHTHDERVYNYRIQRFEGNVEITLQLPMKNTKAISQVSRYARCIASIQLCELKRNSTLRKLHTQTNARTHDTMELWTCPHSITETALIRTASATLGNALRRCCANLQIFRRCKPSSVTMQSCKYSALLPHGISMQTCGYLCIVHQHQGRIS